MPQGDNPERKKPDGSNEFDICIEFDCDPAFCKKQNGVDCYSEYWKPTCFFHGEHQILNEGVEY